MIHDDEPEIYVRRWFVLGAYGLIMFGWNLTGGRTLAVSTSYALYFNTTNELNLPPEYGVDMVTWITNFTLLFTYFFGAYGIDRWGLRCMNVSALAIAISGWMWYLAGNNLVIVLLSQVFSCIFGPFASSALLAISNRWFPERERARATGIGSLVNVLGAGAALIVSPMFRTAPNQVLDLTLKSCISSPAMELVYQQALSNGTAAECIGDLLYAKEEFCCYLPLDIPTLDFFMAIFPTLVFVFSLIAVRDLPPTPPSASSSKKEFVGLFTSAKNTFSNEGFSKLSLSDFIVSGPPLVLVATIARVFPASVSDYSFLASVAGLALAIPSALIVAHYLDKTKRFWNFAFFGYAIGTLFWILGTICFVSGTDAGAWVFMGFVTLAIAAYVVWQTAVFECKLEYVFDKDVNLEGYIVGIDRIIINLSSTIFIALIPPERTGSPMNTFLIGAVIMLVGCVPVSIIKHKHSYLRLENDLNHNKASTKQVDIE